MNKTAEYIRELDPEAEIKEGEPMSLHTTFRTGGPAEVFVRPGSTEGLQKSLRFCCEHQIPFEIIGRGSNLLAGDQGIDGVVFCLTSLNAMELHGTVITAGAGCTLSAIAAAACEAGLTGFEFAAGIPGSLGGAVAMNAGAYGGEMKQVLGEVLLLDRQGNIFRMKPEELELGYRSSRILKEGYIVLQAELNLQPGDRDQIRSTMKELAEKRIAKQPLEYPSAGSTFKRPEGYFAGKLIQDSGLAGYSVGGAAVSEKHCGFVINKGNAVSADILQLCVNVSEIVYEKFGVELEMEVRKIGKF